MKMMLKNKRGAGHVEVILSFVIFVGFLIFLFFIFNPFSIKDNTSFVETAFFNLEEISKTSVESISISTITLASVCFKIDELEDMTCNFDNQVRVKDKNGNDLDANVIDNEILIEVSSLLDPDDRFYTISCSDEFFDKGELSGCPKLVLSNGDYSLGIIIMRDPWSDRKLQQLRDDYQNSYFDLKNKIVPEGNDFEFTVWDIDSRTVLYEGKQSSRPRGIDIFARTFAIDVVYDDNRIEKRTITVSVF